MRSQRKSKSLRSRRSQSRKIDRGLSNRPFPVSPPPNFGDRPIFGPPPSYPNFGDRPIFGPPRPPRNFEDRDRPIDRGRRFQEPEKQCEICGSRVDVCSYCGLCERCNKIRSKFRKSILPKRHNSVSNKRKSKSKSKSKSN